MSIQEIVDFMKEKPYVISMGANKVATWLNALPSDVRKARRLAKEELRRMSSGGARILLFDIETSPLKAFVWQTQVWKARINTDQVLSEWFLLTWSAKWLYEDEILSDKLTSKEALKEDDSRIVKSLWKLLDEADVVIAHNGDRFDVPNINTRMVVSGLKPPKSYQSIDTVKVARKEFGFTHNSLNALAKVFGFDTKIDTDFELWVRCVEGEEKALKEMEIYNKRDVGLLEEVYLKLRPWIKSHPNLGLFIDTDDSVCPACGSKELIWQEGHYYYTGVSKFPVWTCTCEVVGVQHVAPDGQHVAFR